MIQRINKINCVCHGKGTPGRIVNGHIGSLNRNTYQVSTVGMKFSKILKVLSFDLSQILSQSKHLDWCLESKLTSK